MITDGTAQATDSNGLSEDQAAERIAALLTPKGDSDGGETPKERKPKAEAPALDEEPEGDEPDDDSEDEESEAEDETEEADEETPPTFTVKVDGEEVAVTLDELQRGYSRTQDYTRKTMELAEARKALEPEVHALREEREQYANLLPQVYAFITNQRQSPELAQLRQSDPAEWAARTRELEQQDAAVRAEYERVTTAKTADEAQALEAEKVRESRALLGAVPEFAQGSTFEDTVSYAYETGFTPDEMADTTNHRAYVVLWKAMQYDRIKAKAPQVRAKVDAVRTARPGAQANQPSRASDITRAKQRLAKTGRVEDAQAAIERLLG